MHNAFLDVDAAEYYAAGVTWAFLWRAAGCPQPETDASPFLDVQDPAEYYYDAVLWAVEQGVTTGMEPDRFAPDDTVTRGQTVVFLWRLAGTPEAAAENPFTDVPEEEYYHDAILWAVEQAITTGVEPDRFAPDAPCTRGQIVTFLYRDFGLEAL